MKLYKIESVFFISIFLFSSIAQSQEYITRSHKIDVPAKGGCDQREGTIQILLPPGYKYYDYEYIETNASPKPGNVIITPNPTNTGANVSWKVPFLNASSGVLCIGDEATWLKATVNVRGVKE